MQRKNLGEMLVAANLIDEVQMRIALAEQARTGKKFGSTLVDLQFIDENVLAAFLSKQIDIPCISLLNIDIPKKVLRRVPAAVARDCRAIPIRLEGDKLEVAMVDPTDLEMIHALETGTGMTVIPLIAPQSSIEKMIDRFYAESSRSAEDTMTHPEAAEHSVAADPIFIDLIEEIEDADLDNRLRKIEKGIGELWVLLERILRTLEARDVPLERPAPKK